MNSTLSLARSQAEIAARVTMLQQEGNDFLGFRQAVVIEALDFAHARPFLIAEATESDWTQTTDVLAAATDYLAFAWTKAREHRGISAGRSVEKLSEYAWLLGLDDVFAQMHGGVDYSQYGAPALLLFSRALGLPEGTADPALIRMAEGLPCEPDCMDGCER